MTKSLPTRSLVLYAEDDTDDRELLTEIFAEYAAIIELVTFGTGQELLDYLKSLHPLQPQPCLVILDINMPILDGKATLKTLRQTDRFDSVPVVLFTTSTLPHEAAFAEKHSAGFVTKPIHLGQVHQIVDQMLQHCTDSFKRRVERHRRE
ncbi:MAG: response regulator [Flaviaesturariibacter sp.]|nr:response regulator [Flaviaesturariibacter sp.]